MKSAIVVGSGFAGLSAALELARAGVAVTVCEAADRPGGRAQLHESPDGRFRFDMGPTIITMRDTLARTLGKDAMRELELRRLEPGYRVAWSDGESFDMHSDVALWLAEVTRLGGGAADALKFLSDGYEMLDGAMAAILENPWTGSSWTRLFTSKPRLKPWAMGSLKAMAARAFSHPKLVEAMTFQTLYLGMTPNRAPAAYSLLAAQEIVDGIWYARGGAAAIVASLARRCEAHGVTFRYATRVTNVVRYGKRARGVETTSGTFAADAVVLACDRDPALRTLLQRPAKRAVRYGHSALVYYLGFSNPLALPHHTVLLPSDTERLYADLDAGRVPSSLALYACNPFASDDTATPGALTVLVPIPNLGRVQADHDAIFVQVLEALETRFGVRANDVRYRYERGPKQFETELGVAFGAAFGPSHDLLQMGPFRPSIDCPGLRNVAFAGSGTRPGSGVPLALISGRLAAARLLERVS